MSCLFGRTHFIIIYFYVIYLRLIIRLLKASNLIGRQFLFSTAQPVTPHMLEGPVANLLNRYLGSYIDGLNKERLRVAVWGGEHVTRII